MNIVCSTLNSKFIHSSLAPWCLKAGVDCFCENRHNVFVVESTVNASIDEFVQNIIDKKPDLVAFSCYIWNVLCVNEVTKKLKAALSCPICLGGPEVAFTPADTLVRFPDVDYIISGEGEWSFSSFVDALDGCCDMSETEGVSYINEDLTCITTEQKKHSETPPSPYCEEYFNNLNGRIAYLEASRGCPFRCSYCLSGCKSGFRTFNFDRICSDIKLLSYSGTKTIKFVDRTFNADKNFANKILSFIKDNYGHSIRTGVCFHFEIAGDILSSDTLEILKSMPHGVCQLEIGIQSFTPCVLDNIHRHTNTQKLCQNIEALMSFDNMHIHTDLIAGLPGEDITSFEESFNRAFALKTHMLQLGFLKILFGADIERQILDYELFYKSTPPYEILSTASMSENDFLLLKNCECALDKLYNSGRFLFTTLYLIKTAHSSAFDFFCDIGTHLKHDGMSMSDIVEKIYSAYRNTSFADELKEILLCDVACSGANISLPKEFKAYNPLYKKLKKDLTEKLKTNVKIVILEKENKVFVVESDSRKDLRNRKPYRIYNINDIIK